MTGHASCIGAAAAAATLMGADAWGIAAAIRIASAHAPVSTGAAAGPRESIGWAAFTAVTSSWLALDDFTDARADDLLRPPISATVFEQAGGDPFVDGLGTVFEILETYTKPYACCRAIHAALDALNSLGASATPIAAIERIDVGVPESMLGMDNRAPANLEEAQFSFPVVIAAHVLGRGVDSRARDVDHFRGPGIDGLAARVFLHREDDANVRPGDQYPATVQLRTSRVGGSCLIAAARGASSTPLSVEAVVAKARTNLACGPPQDALVEFCLIGEPDRRFVSPF